MLYIKTANVLIKRMDSSFKDIVKMDFKGEKVDKQIKINIKLIDSWYLSHSKKSFKDVLPIMIRILKLPPNTRNTSIATWGMLWCTKEKDELGLIIHINMNKIVIKISPEIEQQHALQFTNEFKQLLVVHNWS